ncbi:MAG: S8 family serine peptidase, partial [Ilumatobacteraceae bacterium]
VGAVDPPASGTVGSYSSQGPTNDGRVKPDVVAASGADSVTFGATFSGTSASAPVVAGGAALLLQAGLAADARSLGDLVRHAVIDRGPAGRDNAYGTGEFVLPTPPTDVADPAPSRYVPLDTPTRVLDTRPSSAIGPSALIGDPWPGRIVDLPVEAIPGVGEGGTDPGAVTAVAANVTVVDVDRPGFTQAHPTARAMLGAFSNSNVDTAGQTRPNLMIVPVGTGERFSVYNTAGGHLLVDVLGTFTATGGAVTGGRFVDLPAAQRVLDTRTGGQPVGSGGITSFGVPDTVERADIAALVVNVTATQTAGQGFVQAFPAGRDDEIGRTSTLNLTDGATVANTVIVPVGDGDGDGAVSLFAELGPGGAAHLIADVTGYITSDAAPSSTAGRFVPVRPGRAFDSRALGGPLPSGDTADVRATDVSGVDLPASTSAIVWNFTATATTRPGFLAGWPADGPEPATSALNWTLPDTTVANGGIVAASDGGVMRIRVDGGPLVAGVPLTHAVIDVFGYFT